LKSLNLVVLGVFLTVSSIAPSFGSVDARTPRPIVAANENRVPAGTLTDHVLHLSLEALWGKWYPDGPRGAFAPIQSFAEMGKAPQIPGPLIRVPLNTVVVVSVRNSIPGTQLTMHGLVSRPALGDRPFTVAYGQTRVVRFRAGAQGTFLYWGSTTGNSFINRFGSDSQLNGAIVVDPAGTNPRTASDRIFMVSVWDNVHDAKGNPNFDFILETINGRSWPYTERLSYLQGATVHWRLLNGSFEAHPLHLHGFFFTVDSRGDGIADNAYAPSDRDTRVTELIEPGHTFSMTWHATRAGNWLFHCHITYHVMPHVPIAEMLSGKEGKSYLDTGVAGFSHRAHMGGLILALTVRPKGRLAADPPFAESRRLGLIVEPGADDRPDAPSLRYVLEDGRQTIVSPGQIGPPIVLNRGVSVAIDVTNHLQEPTAVHWHGIELQDSYYDGVMGWSGQGNHVAPMIMPGETFEVQMTPPRAGTFIYHTHLDDLYQLRGGLAGPLIVLNPGERFDPNTDHIFIMSIAPKLSDLLKVLVNGVFQPEPLVVQAGVRQRLRFINITTFWTNEVVSISSRNRVAQWIPIAVDGAGIPDTRRSPQPAVDTVTVGQTRDYEFTPQRGDFLLQIWPDPSVPPVDIPVHALFVRPSLTRELR
jgi:manganese oxidase